MRIPRPVKRAIKSVLFPAMGLIILGDYLRFKKELKKTDRTFRLRYSEVHPVLNDKNPTVTYDRHYVYHVGWAVRCVKAIAPKKHVDIGSSMYFSATLSAFIPVDFYDYRPTPINLSGLTSQHGDLTALPFKDNELTSLSCLHTLEHVGLGRYGDPIDPNGDIKSFAELSRVVAPGGNLLVVVPTGKEARIDFNAHRVYTYDNVLSYLPGFTLHTFSYIPEKPEGGGIIDQASRADIADDAHGCGCYWFIKNRS